MPLTDKQCQKAAPGERNYKLADSGGLYLFVTPKGGKSWRLKYRFGGKEKLLTFGLYPEVPLREARDRRDEAKRLLREHRDPAIEARKIRAAAYAAAGATFKVVAERWYQAQLGRWAKVNATKIAQAMQRDVYPEIGGLPLTDIDGPAVLAVLRKVEQRGAIDTAKRIRQHISAVFGYGMAEGLCAADPAGRHLLKAMLPTPIGGSQPGLRTIAELRELHATIDASTGGPLTKLASRLLGLTFVRPGLIPTARWEEFEGIDWSDPTGAGDAPEPIWRIAADRMKLEQENKADEAFEHIVPLVPQAVDVLRAVHRLSGRFPYLFHSVRSTHQPMSANTIGYRYNQCGYRNRHVPHGWRSAFSTIMNERATVLGLEGDRPIIDAMLSHKPRGISAAEMAYNRARHMPRRWELARWWADETMKGLPPAGTLLDGWDRAG
ncbi:integrase [Sphingomonas kyeonggiensis]|uniref:tyrosine-type recombinase/integrase n=1 Tax=Sphingomonas kyeonggiensis TaxID=1268553 RepID=UPI0027832981|nr:integrase arm-type DNA-binding domain-containing protein [Sphingomonas kyeonggiensis]MDQ0249224.1 integrase [Sphingomonas kyeonggiensis]